MCQLLETLCYLNGSLRHLELHQARLDAACEEFGYTSFSLEDILASHLPGLSYEKMKVRVLYGKGAPVISVEPYRMLPNKSLKMIYNDTISYHHKFSDRTTLNHLYTLRGGCDNILIIKNGLVTDTAYTNVVLYDGTDWVTPEEPLLKGTMRQALLNEGRITEKKITLDDLGTYEKILLINAMISLEDKVEVEELR